LGLTGGVLLLLGGLGFAFSDHIGAAFKGMASNYSREDEDGAVGTGGKAGKRKKLGKGFEARSGDQYPRRAMIISVHNYLYANPIVDNPNPPNISRLIASLNIGLKIPLPQIIHLSDAAKKDARPPLKKVIEEGLTNFLKTTRNQDRILVFFIGHTREIDGEAYLVPLEGEMNDPKTLIPLKWFYTQLEQCSARQKVLVIDGNRYNAGQGEERPGSGPMGKKFAELLSKPPAGVQVWSACSADQLSHELGESSLGLFLDSMRLALTPEKGAKGALEGRIQKADDLVPVEALHKTMSTRMGTEAEKFKVKQLAMLAGSPPAEGADFDRTEEPAAIPALPTVRTGDIRLVQEIMNDISLPPLKGGQYNSDDVAFTMLPPFPDEQMKSYAGGQLPADSKLRKLIQETRIMMWAVSTAQAPRGLASEVTELRKTIGVDLSIMRDSYTDPGDGKAQEVFKNRVFEDSKAMARIVARLERTLERFKDKDDEELKEELKKAPMRWQANYKFVLARLQAQLAYLEDYQSQLGSVRKELPPLEKGVHTGWKLASKAKATDSLGKKYDRAARALYAELIKENRDTPWAVLAKREELTSLGLQWQPF